MSIPKHAPYVVVGAGIHGLSTAYHLAKELRMRGAGSGADVVVLDKSKPGAGASGIACGVVRNNYFQPAMSELMQACVEVWESDPARAGAGLRLVEDDHVRARSDPARAQLLGEVVRRREPVDAGTDDDVRGVLRKWHLLLPHQWCCRLVDRL